MTRPDVTLRELDVALGLAKGSAFRAFKRLAANWHEGTDFRVLDATRDAGAIAALRSQGRIYASSRNVVLLDEPMAEAIRRALREPAAGR